LASPYFIYAF